MNDLISRAELFNKLATIHAPMEANEYKAQVYAVIQEMEALESNCDGCTIAGLAEAFAKDYMHCFTEKIIDEIRRNQNGNQGNDAEHGETDGGRNCKRQSKDGWQRGHS